MGHSSKCECGEFGLENFVSAIIFRGKEIKWNIYVRIKFYCN